MGRRGDGLYRRTAEIVLLLAALLIGGCQSNDDTETPEPSPDGGERITGRERLGWDQAAEDVAQLNSFHYAIYVDNNRSELGEVRCEGTRGPSGFPCSGRLPAMTNGIHVLELAVFTTTPSLLEGPRSAPFRVTVAAATTPAENPLSTGDRITTRDGVQLLAAREAESFVDIADAAIATDGRLVIAERTGRITFLAAGAESITTTTAADDGQLLALTLSPDFSRSGHLFVVQARGGVFRVARYRLFEGQLIERMLVLPDVPASTRPTASVRFGPDGKLYVAFDDAGNRSAALKLFEWSGKILRLNPDGSTPDDQPAASPVFWSGMAAPGGLDWPRDSRLLWIAETGGDGVERLRALSIDGARPRRPGMKTSSVLPPPVGATSHAFYRSDDVPELRNDLFVAARKGGYLLRVRFDENDSSRAMTTEKLLEGRLGEVRAVVAAPDGGLYVMSATDVWRLRLDVRR
jgi:glucose/arabinose dehydrogenase